VIFRARQFRFEFPRPALVMGIVNVTPDSFSDGGKFFDAQAAVAHAEALATEGAEIIDVGGESTRPGARPVSEEEELRRVLPVIQELAGRIKVPISIDTMKPDVAARAIEVGAAIVNDVAANRRDPAMWGVVAKAGAGYICMHMQGTPETMQTRPTYQDVVAEVKAFFLERLERLHEHGVSAEQVALDPGIGFGKTVAHNLQLIAHLREFTTVQRPLMLGVSRKSFLGKAGGGRAGECLPAALACASLAIEAGVGILRAHDVAETLQAVRMTEAIIAGNKACPGAGKRY
jgi:dihydropteroate synthase